MIPTKVSSAGKFFFWFKTSFLIIFCIVLLVNAISSYFPEKDLTKTISILGKAFYDPFDTINQDLKELNSSSSTGLLDSLGKYFELYYNIYILYIWFFILGFLVRLFFESMCPPIIRIFITLALFYFVMVLFSVLILKESINMPFEKSWQILKGLYTLFSNPQFNPSLKLPDGIINNSNSCVDSVCVV